MFHGQWLCIDRNVEAIKQLKQCVDHEIDNAVSKISSFVCDIDADRDSGGDFSCSKMQNRQRCSRDFQSELFIRICLSGY